MKGINMKIINIACAFLALAAPSFAGGADFTLYNVMPFSPGREAQCAADCREYRDRTGCDLVLYSLTLHPEGKPAMEKVDRYVASYRALRRELDGSGVHLGVLVQAIIGHWPRVDKDIEDWTRTVNIKGGLRTVRGTRRQLTESTWKRAIVEVKPGERIEIL